MRREERVSEVHRLTHPLSRCTIEFSPAPDYNGITMVQIVSRRPGRRDLPFGPVCAELARLWWRGWKAEGFVESKGKPK
jgi:hypothetical protein